MKEHLLFRQTCKYLLNFLRAAASTLFLDVVPEYDLPSVWIIATSRTRVTPLFHSPWTWTSPCSLLTGSPSLGMATPAVMPLP